MVPRWPSCSREKAGPSPAFVFPEPSTIIKSYTSVSLILLNSIHISVSITTIFLKKMITMTLILIFGHFMSHTIGSQTRDRTHAPCSWKHGVLITGLPMTSPSPSSFDRQPQLGPNSPTTSCPERTTPGFKVQGKCVHGAFQGLGQKDGSKGWREDELFSEHSGQRIVRHPSCSQWLVRRVRDGLQVWVKNLTGSEVAGLSGSFVKSPLRTSVQWLRW